MEIDNKNLYESDEVVSKYANNSTRLRNLNNPEKYFIDQFDIKNKKVLVVGGGAGRLPINLILYGNEVVSVDRSSKLTDFAKKEFPKNDFSRLEFVLADALDLSSLEDEYFDAVIFPMNSIDYVGDINSRKIAKQEAFKKLKKGGLLIFSSHNKLAYFFSPKIRHKDRSLKTFSGKYRYTKESVVGGGYIFKGNPNFVIKETEKLLGVSFKKFFVDSRNKLERFLSKSLFFSKFYFPYFVYVFKK